MQLTQSQIADFQRIIWNYYAAAARPFSWRETRNPYHIVVSEIMLQQTQTHRVVDKFEQFIGAFPDFESLAQAPMRDLLGVWQGLGYNRRGVALQKIAQQVVLHYNGQLPADPVILETFPGIGPATASSICAFAFDMPTVFIETNIRAVYLHFFFPGQENIHDKQLRPLVEQTVVHENARHWYYALMDYGVMLKKQFKNPSRKSAHHAVQSKFEGSDRQIRGMVIKLLTQQESAELPAIIAFCNRPADRVHAVVQQLHAEKMIKLVDEYYCL